MALEFHEKEKLQLLPSELLNYDDIFSDNRGVARIGSISYGFGSSGSSSSGLSSPFGSELGSTETESDEDDDGEFMAELTRLMADYMLGEDDENALKNSCGLPESPQSTVSGSDCKLGSIDNHSEELQSTIEGPTPATANGCQAFSDDQSRAVHFYKLENQPSVKHQGPVCGGRRVKRVELTQQLGQKQQIQHQNPHHGQNRGRRSDAVGGGGGGCFGSPATEAWPPLQQRRRQTKQQLVGSGSGMRAVFLGGTGSRSGSCGTGVFLPRGTGNPTEFRKKSECSTVLIPARVLQALQLHFEEMNNRSQSKTSAGVTSHAPQHDVAMTKTTRPAAVSNSNHQEVDLPQEWTY